MEFLGNKMHYERNPNLFDELFKEKLIVNCKTL